MMKEGISIFMASIILLGIHSCRQQPSIDLPIPQKTSYQVDSLELSYATYHDKILGAIVGSAIGDAMGASTEMWHRHDIQAKYGYITGLTPAIRQKSPEGTWRHNMILGSTTDDTRWKYLMTQYLTQYADHLEARHFADFVVDYYRSQTDALKNSHIEQSTDLLESHIDRLHWITEWARVAMAYQDGTEAYIKAQARFYGGEMSCAGMLYAPMLGLIELDPSMAYELGFEHALFDIGYARDIAGLTAAMTSLSVRGSTIDSILDAIELIDPYEFKDSRLIGRLTEGIARTARHIVTEGLLIQSPDPQLKPPPSYTGSELQWTQLQAIYDDLDQEKQAIPFHAGEIWQITIAALAYGDGNFEETMRFIVNYGRDNDTVAAVAGMILGTQLGYAQLPQVWKDQVQKTNKEIIGIDLAAMATQLTP